MATHLEWGSAHNEPSQLPLAPIKGAAAKLRIAMGPVTSAFCANLHSSGNPNAVFQVKCAPFGCWCMRVYKADYPFLVAELETHASSHLHRSIGAL